MFTYCFLCIEFYLIIKEAPRKSFRNLVDGLASRAEIVKAQSSSIAHFYPASSTDEHFLVFPQFCSWHFWNLFLPFLFLFDASPLGFSLFLVFRFPEFLVSRGAFAKPGA